VNQGHDPDDVEHRSVVAGDARREFGLERQCADELDESQNSPMTGMALQIVVMASPAWRPRSISCVVAASMLHDSPHQFVLHDASFPSESLGVGADHRQILIDFEVALADLCIEMLDQGFPKVLSPRVRCMAAARR